MYLKSRGSVCVIMPTTKSQPGAHGQSTAVLCDTNRYRRNIGIEIEKFRYFWYRIGIGIERGVK